MRLAPSVSAGFGLLIVVATLGSPTGSAATGDLVHSVVFSQNCGSSIGVGLAFDGTHLWYSCYASTPNLFRADAMTGAVVATYTVGGGLGALSYDATRNGLWAGWGDGSCCTVQFLQLDAAMSLVGPTTTFPAPQAGVCGLDDGIAYDAEDDTLYVSDDCSTQIHRYTSAGVYIGAFSWAGTGCANSGLAIGGDLLYEGADGCNTAWVVSKAATSTVLFSFPTAIAGDPNFRDEDLECDTTTFEKNVMWSKEAFNPMRAHAFEIPMASCGEGGAAPPVPELGTMVLLSAGLATVGLVVLRRRA